MPNEKGFLPDDIRQEIENLCDWPRPMTEAERRLKEIGREVLLDHIQKVTGGSR